MKRLLTLILFLTLCIGCKEPSVNTQEVFVVIPFPNPTSSEVRIYIRNEEKSRISLQVFDPKSNLIFEKIIEAGDPTDMVGLDLRDKEKGSYQIILTKNTYVYTTRFIKV